MPPRLGALLAVGFWGVSFVATRAAVVQTTPLTLVTLRTALGLALLLGLQAAGRRPLLPPRDSWPALLGMGFVGVAFHQVLQAWALTMTTAVSTGWLIGLTPLWSTLLAAWRLGERLSARKVVGLVLGLAGAALVVSRGRIDAGALSLPATRGDLLVLGSTLNWAFYTVIGHGTLRRLGPLPATTGGMGFGLLLLLPLWAAQGSAGDLAGLSASGWLAVAFLGVCCSGLGYLFWYGALERLPASQVSAFLYLEPLVTLAAAVMLLGEPVGLATVLGGALLLAGVALLQRAG